MKRQPSQSSVAAETTALTRKNCGCILQLEASLLAKHLLQLLISKIGTGAHMQYPDSTEISDNMQRTS